MLKNNELHKLKVQADINRVASMDLLPVAHKAFLYKLREDYKFNPKIIYDIGSCTLHWYNVAKQVWNDSEIIVFDAFTPLEDLYKENNLKYHIGVLGEEDNKQVPYFVNDLLYGGCSRFKEINDTVFPPSNYVMQNMMTLDAVVKKRAFPYCDLLKADIQGSEMELLLGCPNVLKRCKFLILELQEKRYNIGAKFAHEVIDYLASIGWELIAPKFSINDADSDYCFRNNNLKE